MFQVVYSDNPEYFKHQVILNLTATKNSILKTIHWMEHKHNYYIQLCYINRATCLFRVLIVEKKQSLSFYPLKPSLAEANMGQMMGSFNARNVDLYMDDKPTFDPQAGFNFERKQRVMIAKEEELESARIPPEYRDYCSHLLLPYHECRYKNMPLVYKCAHEKHAYLNCQQEDYVLRMKEFERERRLRLREQRLVGVA